MNAHSSLSQITLENMDKGKVARFWRFYQAEIMRLLDIPEFVEGAKEVKCSFIIKAEVVYDTQTQTFRVTPNIKWTLPGPVPTTTAAFRDGNTLVGRNPKQLEMGDLLPNKE